MVRALKEHSVSPKNPLKDPRQWLLRQIIWKEQKRPIFPQRGIFGLPFRQINDFFSNRIKLHWCKIAIKVGKGNHDKRVLVARPELSDPVIEGQDLCGADESESVGVEQHDQVLAGIVGEFDVRQFTLRQVRQGFFPS